MLERADELPKGKRQGQSDRDARAGAAEPRRWCGWTATCRLRSIGMRRRVEGVDREALVDLFTELGFHSLTQKFAALPERMPRRRVARRSTTS